MGLEWHYWTAEIMNHPIGKNLVHSFETASCSSGAKAAFGRCCRWPRTYEEWAASATASRQPGAGNVPHEEVERVPRDSKRHEPLWQQHAAAGTWRPDDASSVSPWRGSIKALVARAQNGGECQQVFFAERRVAGVRNGKSGWNRRASRPRLFFSPSASSASSVSGKREATAARLSAMATASERGACVNAPLPTLASAIVHVALQRNACGSRMAALKQNH